MKQEHDMRTDHQGLAPILDGAGLVTVAVVPVDT
jgi:hypothetical protein